jgi:hypothetical protein
MPPTSKKKPAPKPVPVEDDGASRALSAHGRRIAELEEQVAKIKAVLASALSLSIE